MSNGFADFESTHLKCIDLIVTLARGIQKGVIVTPRWPYYNPQANHWHLLTFFNLFAPFELIFQPFQFLKQISDSFLSIIFWLFLILFPPFELIFQLYYFLNQITNSFLSIIFWPFLNLIASFELIFQPCYIILEEL